MQSWIWNIGVYFLCTLASATACEDGWVLHQEYCYYPPPKRNDVSTLETYLKAQDACWRRGGDLTSVQSEEESKLIYSLITRESTAWVRWTNSGSWGDEERNDERSFEDTNLVNVSDGAPALVHPCTFVSPSRNGVWISASCEELRTYICKKPRVIESKSRPKRSWPWTKVQHPGRKRLFPNQTIHRHIPPRVIPRFHSRFGPTFTHPLDLSHYNARKRFQEKLRSSLVTILPPPTLLRSPERHRLGFFGSHKTEGLDLITPRLYRGHEKSISLTTDPGNIPALSKRAPESGTDSVTLPGEETTASSLGASMDTSIMLGPDGVTENPPSNMPTIPNIMISPTPVPVVNECREGDVFFNGSCYILPNSKDKQDFHSALANCKARGALLVILNNSIEQHFVSELLQNISTPVWIGLTHLAKGSNKTLQWVDGISADRSYYRYIAKDVDAGTCASVSSNLTEPGTWLLQNCDQNQLPYICEYAPEAKNLFGRGCVDGWELVQDRCYKVFSKPASWNAAERYCNHFGAHLTSADSVEEEDILRRLGQNTDAIQFFNTLWVGLEISSLSNYLWTDGTPIGYLNWAEGQPDFHQGKEHCGSATRGNFRLHDSPCDTSLPFICEAKEGAMLVFEPQPQLKPNSTCEDDPSWYLYNDHCYKIISSKDEDPQTWWKSRRLCRDIGGELASIHSVEENYWLQSKVHSLEDEVLWIGGSAYMNSGYEWTDATPYDFTNWAKGEPSNNFDQEDCIAFYTRNYGYWNDQNCGHPQGRICKRPLGSTHPPPVTTPIPEGNCPFGWIHAGTKCLKFIEKRVNFDDARKGCKALDDEADLMSIASAKEQAYVTAALGVVKMNMWIGLRYESGYHWMDQSALTYTNWAQGEPSSGGWLDQEHNENCVDTFIYNLSGQWNNVDCDALLGYICQTKLNPNIAKSSPLPTCESPFDNYYSYSGMCYRPENNAQTWEEAEKICIADGGHLASTVSRAETAWLWVVSQHHGVDDPWIGFNNKKDSNVFEWSDDWPTINTKWGHGEPNVSQPGYNCVRMGSGDGLWYTANCDEKRSFICKHNDERLPTPDPPTGGTCPDERWLDFGGAFCYLLVSEASPWDDANKRCGQEESNLASIHSKAEMDLIVQAAHNIRDHMWIGLVQMKDGFGWSDNTGYDFINWKEGEPNGEGEEGCTEIYPGTGLWNDAFCSNARAFICKTPKQVEGGGGNDSLADLTAPAELTTKRSPTAGAIAGIVIPLLLLVFGGIVYLTYRYMTKPRPLGDSGAYGFDNAAYSVDESNHIDIVTTSISMRNITDDDSDYNRREEEMYEQGEEKEEEEVVRGAGRGGDSEESFDGSPEVPVV